MERTVIATIKTGIIKGAIVKIITVKVVMAIIVKEAIVKIITVKVVITTIIAKVEVMVIKVAITKVDIAKTAPDVQTPTNNDANHKIQIKALCQARARVSRHVLVA